VDAWSITTATQQKINAAPATAHLRALDALGTVYEETKAEGSAIECVVSGIGHKSVTSIIHAEKYPVQRGFASHEHDIVGSV
jgi:hypothetical protein